ncbi:MAG: hypothetical protein GY852_11985 [bacterium]|nr:hypothetical protein [bacterium]
MRLNAIILVLALVMGFSFAVACGPGGLNIFDSDTYILDDDLNCIGIYADDVVLDCNGYTIDCDGPSYGIILIDERENIEIHDCIVRNCEMGLYFSHAEYLNVHDNVFEYNNIGIVDDNVFSLINSTIANNTIGWNAWYGMAFDNVNNSVISDNELHDNCWDASPWSAAIYFDRAENTVLEGNDIHDNNCTGIWVNLDSAMGFHNQNVDILENEVYENNGTGINLSYAGNSSINDNEVYSNNGIGIAVHDSAEIIIDPNIVYDNTWHGIYLNYVSYSEVLDNEVYDNCWDAPPPGNCGGIFLDFVAFSLIEGNEVYGHDSGEIGGIWVGASMGVTLFDNNVYENNVGIVSVPTGSNSEGLVIDDCRVYDNEYAGFYLEDGDDTEVINCRVFRNGELEEGESSGLYARNEDNLYIGNSDFDDNFHGLALIDSFGALEDLTISDSEIHGIAMANSNFLFWDLTLIDNWAAIGMESGSTLGYDDSEGLSIYGDTEFYLAQEMGCIAAWDIWLGSDRNYGAWYEGMEVCDVWAVDGENILIRNTFISFDHDDGLGPVGEPTFVTTAVAGCNGLEFYFEEDFPESRIEIILDGETYEPEFECAGTRASYTIDTGATGYTATGIADKKSSDDPEPECTSDSDCDECEYCSIVNNACLPVTEPCGEEEPECTTDAGCPIGTVCINEECVKEEEPEPEPEPEGGEGTEPECSTDDDCIAGLICMDQECVQPEPECLEDVDCPAELVCVEEKCIEKEPEGPTEEDAEKALEGAKEAIDKAKGEGKDTSDAEALLNEAEAALADGDPAGAAELAEKAKLAAEAAAAPPADEETFIPSSEKLPPAEEEMPPEEEFPWVWVFGGIIILGGVVYIIFKWGK